MFRSLGVKVEADSEGQLPNTDSISGGRSHTTYKEFGHSHQISSSQCSTVLDDTGRVCAAAERYAVKHEDKTSRVNNNMEILANSKHNLAESHVTSSSEHQNGRGSREQPGSRGSSRPFSFADAAGFQGDICNMEQKQMARDQLRQQRAESPWQRVKTENGNQLEQEIRNKLQRPDFPVIYQNSKSGDYHAHQPSAVSLATSGSSPGTTAGTSAEDSGQASGGRHLDAEKRLTSRNNNNIMEERSNGDLVIDENAEKREEKSRFDRNSMVGMPNYGINQLPESVTQPQPQARPRNTPPVREAVDPAKYIQIHDTDGVKYACSKCGNIYKWRKSLNKHWKEKHDGEAPPPRKQGQYPASFNSMKVAKGMGLSSGGRAPSLPYQRSPAAESYKRQYMSSRSQQHYMFGPSPPKYPKPPSLPAFDHGGGAAVFRQNLFKKETHPEFKQQPEVGSFDASKPPSAHGNHGKNYMLPEQHLIQKEVREGAAALDLSGPTGLGVAPMAEQEVALDLSTKSRCSSHKGNEQQPIDFSNKSKEIDAQTLPRRGPLEALKNVEVYDLPSEQLSVGGELQCSACPYVAPNQAEHLRHMQSTHGGHRCTACRAEFSNVDELNAHFAARHLDLLQELMAKFSADDGFNTAGDAGDSLTSLKHIVNQFDNSVLKCVVCGERFHWKYDLVLHFDQAHSVLPSPYKGQDAGKEPGEIRRHQVTPPGDVMEDGRAMAACGQCDFTAHSATALARHQLVHSVNKPYACHRCGFSCKDRHTMAYHMDNYHNLVVSPNSIMPIPVTDSDRQSPTYSSAGSDVTDQCTPTKTHHQTGDTIVGAGGEEAIVVIPQAPESTSLGLHTPPPNHGSPRKSGSKRSAATSNGNPDILLPYKCTVCDYRARWPSEITQHMKNHSDEKPYLCPRCTYKSKWKWDVVKHLKRCGGGTIKDVIDTTRQMKGRTVLPPNVVVETSPRRMAAHSNALPPLSTGPPNVTMATGAGGFLAGGVEMHGSSNSPPTATTPEKTSPTTPAAARSLLSSGNLSCRQCNYSAVTSSELRRHEATEHEHEPKSFVCFSCGFITSEQLELRHHLQEYMDHVAAPAADDTDQYGDVVGVRPLEDDDLASSTNQRSGIESIGKAANNRLRCKQCEFVAEDLPSFLQHRVSHASSAAVSAEGGQRTSDEPKHRRKPVKHFRCSKCPYSCFKKQGLELHEAMHEPRGSNSLACDFCDYNVYSKSLLAQHMKLHQDCDAQPVFPGELMEAETSADETESSYSNNAAAVTSPFVCAKPKPRRSLKYCSKCSYVTDNATSLQRHILKHGQHAKFACRFCDYSLDKRHQIVAHMKQFHEPDYAAEAAKDAAETSAYNGEEDSDDSSSDSSDAPKPSLVTKFVITRSQDPRKRLLTQKNAMRRGTVAAASFVKAKYRRFSKKRVIEVKSH